MYAHSSSQIQQSLDFGLQTYPPSTAGIGGAGTRQPTYLLCLLAPGYSREEHKAGRRGSQTEEEERCDRKESHREGLYASLLV